MVKDNQIDLILYVASAEERPDLKLFKALQKAKLDSKDEKARSKLKQNSSFRTSSFDKLDIKTNFRLPHFADHD